MFGDSEFNKSAEDFSPLHFDQCSTHQTISVQASLRTISTGACYHQVRIVYLCYSQVTRIYCGIPDADLHPFEKGLHPAKE